MSVLIVCDDLMFTSKVTATARAHGLTTAIARTAADAGRKAPPAGCVIVDLHLPELDLPQLLTDLRAGGSAAVVIGFGSHVDVDTLKAARAAGCDRVMPRSQFVKELETKLPEWAAPPAS
ncbi:MAG: response regulator [Gemmataceae bacterium]